MESLGYGITSRTFCAMLDEALPDVVREGGPILVQDEAIIHTSHYTREWRSMKLLGSFSLRTPCISILLSISRFV